MGFYGRGQMVLLRLLRLPRLINEVTGFMDFATLWHATSHRCSKLLEYRR